MYLFPSRPLYMGRGGQRSATTCGLSWPLPPPAARLLQIYKDCVARGIWARLMFETVEGEEELSFSCRVKGGATRAATSKKQGAKRLANQRRKERARRRRKAWEERRRVSATADAATATAAAGAATATAATGAATATAAAGAATIEVATAAARGGRAANPLSVVAGAAVLAAPVNKEVKEASAAATSAVATAADSAAAASTAAVLQRAKVAVWERRTSARAQILARRRESEGSEVQLLDTYLSVYPYFCNTVKSFI